ncbi:MAG TPA: hypothetical protein VE954_35055 [Oligoflexus sp.]|uniref:hypothetical protein n=1 Tax=Oligoflexus sp. TaxID=1971216 RepID=UPI002D5A9D49|nr:hypothetical protein [Oligoflexus sp.]HYX38351.1 hypothetical protein [Oligoflexus sp.]
MYVLTTLHTYVREGGLSDIQVKDLFELADALIALQKIQPKVSEAAVLLGELHVLRAQLHLSQGEPFLACVEQQLVESDSGIHLPGGKAFQYFSLSRMSLRLGEAALAIEYLDTALRSSLDPSLQPAAKIMKLRALRLSHQWDHADSLGAELAEEWSNNKKWFLEVEWEQWCRQVHKTGDISVLMDKIYPRSDFYQPSYVLESFFWIRSVSTVKWLNGFPKLKSLKQSRNMNFRPLPVYYRCATYLERINDKTIPLCTRLLLVKKVMQSVSSLSDVDKILLVTLSVVRWLIRNQCRDFARIVYTEYSQLSYRLCRKPDVLGIAEDIVGKKW